jgi:hypothetical protein
MDPEKRGRRTIAPVASENWFKKGSVLKKARSTQMDENPLRPIEKNSAALGR